MEYTITTCETTHSTASIRRFQKAHTQTKKNVDIPFIISDQNVKYRYTGRTIHATLSTHMINCTDAF